MNNPPGLLQRFLYMLIRDEVPFGKIERLIREVEKTSEMTVTFSEPRMAEYASSLAQRLSAVTSKPQEHGDSHGS